MPYIVTIVFSSFFTNLNHVCDYSYYQQLQWASFKAKKFATSRWVVFLSTMLALSKSMYSILIHLEHCSLL